MAAPKMDPTERFIAVLADILGKELSDEQRVNLEDAFNYAVEARVRDTFDVTRFDER
jgi:hypothetical protein